MNTLKNILVAYQNGERGLPTYAELAAMVEKPDRRELQAGAQVLEIRAARMATKARVWGAKILARKFGVSRSAVECAANGRNWNDPAIRAIPAQSVIDSMEGKS
jgi:hypothetical protein